MPTSDRREFLGSLAAGAVLGALPLALDPRAALAAPTMPNTPPSPWDLTWTDRVKGRYRVVFDVPEVESGYGVWRATLWQKQYMDVLGVKPADMTPVVVLRHNGIVLAMQQSFWDQHALGKSNNVMHPVTLEPTDRNPVLLASSRNEVPAMFDEVALDRLIARGGIVLACALALDDMIDKIVKRENASADTVRQHAMASFVPGVIMQPSGVFAAIRAQDVGCKYLRAS